MAENLNLKLLQSLLPGLHRDAQAGDAAARRELVRVVDLITRAGFDTAQTPTQPTRPGFTAPTDAPGQAESRSSKTTLDAMLAQAEALPTWHEMYQDLLQERMPVLDGRGQPTGRTRPRWDWRKALYIAWQCTPRDKRWPKFEKELAALLGLSNTRTMRHWREQDPEIGERIARLPTEMLLGHVADVFDALLTVAKDPDPKAHQDRKLFLEITGNYRPSGNVNLSMTPISYIEVPEDDDGAS